MARTSLSGPRGMLNMEQEQVPVHYLSDIDADWRYTDANGHEHHCEYEAADHYPTLRRVTESAYWCGECGDEHLIGHLECRQCGEHIQPGVTGPGTKYIAGPVRYTLDGEEITPEQAAEIIAGWQAARHG